MTIWNRTIRGAAAVLASAIVGWSALAPGAIGQDTPLRNGSKNAGTLAQEAEAGTTAYPAVTVVKGTLIDAEDLAKATAAATRLPLLLKNQTRRAAPLVIRVDDTPLLQPETLAAAVPVKAAVPHNGARNVLVPPRFRAAGYQEEPLAAVLDADGPPAIDAGALEGFFDGAALTQMVDEDIPGMTVSVVKDGQMIFAKGYGYADAKRTRPVDPAATLFRPGSVSKLITWTAVMQLYERGQLDLRTDVNTYLDGTGITIPAKFDAPVTLEHILTHTAGFEDGAIGYLFADDPEKLRPFGEVLAQYQPARVRAPGKVASYSNWAASLAGLIVQNVSGMPFEAYVEEEIFAPLGMLNSTFREPLPEDLAADMSEGLVREDGLFAPQTFEYIANFGPAGGLTSTAADMAAFMLAHLQEGAYQGAQILRPETVRLMHSRLFSHHPDLPGMAHGFYESEINGRRLIAHGGDTLWFHSNLFLLPEEGLGVYISTNAPPGATARSAMTESFMDAFYPQAVEDLEPPEDFDAAPYLGAYRINRHSHTTWEKITALPGQITVRPHESGALLVASAASAGHFVPIGNDVFRKRDGDDRIAFVRNEAGEITLLALGDTPILAAYKLETWETMEVQGALAGFAVLMFVFIVGGTLIHWRRVVAMDGGEILARFLVFLIAGLHLGLLAGLGVLIGGAGNKVIFGLPDEMQIVLGLPVAAAALTLLAVVVGVRAVFGGGTWSFLARIRYLVVLAVSIAFLGFLWYWNLLGWWNLP